ncbi:TetR/AcrR family transcriptional regulator [Aliidiomarina celeris]|uniref:TetR/AcrR family transcriptional regulator n=1 Tax=Aliidiomarina celeris TaxID=2249428 RepID=UPI000DEB852B|nr:TetR/AcrR family transcriptional regulator [Aliidiomarina celeris]
MATRHKLTAGGASTREHILSAAKTVLETVGFAGFSTPRVAKQAGISQGNLTYYFPNRDDLVLAVADSIVEEYAVAFSAFYEKLDTLDLAGFEQIVTWLIDDATCGKTAGVIPELWALSNHNDDVAHAMHKLYDDTACAFARSIGILPSDQRYANFMSVVYFLAATVEGATAIHVTRPSDRDQRLKMLKATAVPTLARMLFDASKV